LGLQNGSWRIRDQLDVTSYYVLFHFFYAQHVSDINTAIIRSLRLFYFITTLVVCYCFDVCWSFGVAGLGWYPCSRLKHNIITSDIKLVSYSSTITMMHGPIYIRSSKWSLSFRFPSQNSVCGSLYLWRTIFPASLILLYIVADIILWGVQAINLLLPFSPTFYHTSSFLRPNTLLTTSFFSTCTPCI